MRDVLREVPGISLAAVEVLKGPASVLFGRGSLHGCWAG
jgi:outer membrane receptor protein involved in Fe transport